MGNQIYETRSGHTARSQGMARRQGPHPKRAVAGIRALRDSYHPAAPRMAAVPGPSGSWNRPSDQPGRQREQH